MKIKSKIILKSLKFILEIGFLILFVGSYLKILNTIPPHLFLKIIFSILYLWFTIGMNINLIVPLLKTIDNKLK
tara:strand:+ start:135 stop:356 length:222 start_codon:yes stop_codon:yes gene_type:complete